MRWTDPIPVLTAMTTILWLSLAIVLARAYGELVGAIWFMWAGFFAVHTITIFVAWWDVFRRRS